MRLSPQAKERASHAAGALGLAAIGSVVTTVGLDAMKSTPNLYGKAVGFGLAVFGVYVTIASGATALVIASDKDALTIDGQAVETTATPA
jgi:hypothetical protein